MFQLHEVIQHIEICVQSLMRPTQNGSAERSGGVIGKKFITKLPYDDGIARNKGNRIKLICAYIARRLQ